MEDKILLNGMEFYGYHGCGEEERRRGQIFTVDAEMSVDLSRSGKSDNLNDTVNYAAVIDEIKQIVTGEPKILIESVAEEIAAVLLNKFPLIESVKIVVSKPAAPIIGTFKSAAVSIVRSRN